MAGLVWVEWQLLHERAFVYPGYYALINAAVAECHGP